MDLLDQHEAFLRAIFDDPDDDTPRIIYADFLEENGQEDRAAFIRAQCEFPRLIPSDLGDPEYHPRLHELLALQARLRRKLLKTHPEQFRENATYRRGFPFPPESVEVTLADLTSPVLLREKAVQMYPEWFSATAAKVVGGQVTTEAQVQTLLESAVLTRVTRLTFVGRMEAHSDSDSTDGSPYFVQVPAISNAAVAALAANRRVRRITSLDLQHNDLDNDAARALVRSPYLDNLKRLDLLQGNRLRGRVWQQVIERFGEDVVG